MNQKKANGLSRLDLKAFIRMKVGTDLVWAYKALDLLMSQQVSWEVRNNSARGRNGVGANKVDTPMFTRLWKMRKTNNTIFRDEERRLLERMQKYAGQLMDLWPPEELRMRASEYYGIVPKKLWQPEFTPGGEM